MKKQLVILITLFINFISCSILFEDIKIDNLRLTSSQIEGVLKNTGKTYYSAVYIEFCIYNSEGKMIYQQAEAIFDVKPNQEFPFSFKRWDVGGEKVEVKKIIKEKNEGRM